MLSVHGSKVGSLVPVILAEAGLELAPLAIKLGKDLFQVPDLFWRIRLVPFLELGLDELEWRVRRLLLATSLGALRLAPLLLSNPLGLLLSAPLFLLSTLGHRLSKVLLRVATLPLEQAGSAAAPLALLRGPLGRVSTGAGNF